MFPEPFGTLGNDVDRSRKRRTPQDSCLRVRPPRKFNATENAARDRGHVAVTCCAAFARTLSPTEPALHAPAARTAHTLLFFFVLVFSLLARNLEEQFRSAGAASARRAETNRPAPTKVAFAHPRAQRGAKRRPFFCLRSPMLGCNTQPRHDRDMSKRGCGRGSAMSIASCSKSACGFFVRLFGNAAPQAASNGQTGRRSARRWREISRFAACAHYPAPIAREPA